MTAKILQFAPVNREPEEIDESQLTWFELNALRNKQAKRKQRHERRRENEDLTRRWGMNNAKK